ncbi:MAG: hypothetical protein JSS83_20070 [Cyanobacteria bacterium SZAS LIN-3]|nr:hypothetical protein [Cyanobacteria bacterium SZAS LIN-3]MBS2005560.1 hypothetical protein [Cyanobacteria bacterium SZAS TMP-1]
MSDHRFIEPKHHEIKQEQSTSDTLYSQIMHDLPQNKSMNETRQGSAEKSPTSDHLPGLHITVDKAAAPQKAEHQDNGFTSGLLKALTMLQPHANEPVQHHELFKPTPFTKALAEGAAAGAGLWNAQQSLLESNAKAHK